MDGNLENRTRALLCEMLKDLPNIAHLNGSGHWHVFPNRRKRRLRIKQNNNHPVVLNIRGPPSIMNTGSLNFRRFPTFVKFITLLLILFLISGFRQRPAYSNPSNFDANVTVYAAVDDTAALVNALVSLTDEDNPSNAYFAVTNDSGKAVIYGVPVGIDGKPRIELPDGFSLEQNFPNPWNPSTKFKYSIPKRGNAKVFLTNLKGDRVKTLVDGVLEPGSYEAEWGGENNNGIDVADGVYFYTVEYDGNLITKGTTKLGDGSLSSSNSKVGEPMFSRQESDLGKIVETAEKSYKLEVANTDSISHEIFPYLMQGIPISQDTTLYVVADKVPRRILTGIITEFFSALPDSGALVKTSVDSAFTDANGEYSVLASNDREDVWVLKQGRHDRGFVVEPGILDVIRNETITANDSLNGLSQWYLNYVLNNRLNGPPAPPDNIFASLTKKSVPRTAWLLGYIENEDGYVASVGFKNVAQLNEYARKINTTADTLTDVPNDSIPHGLYNIDSTRIVIADSVFMGPDSVAKFQYPNMVAVHNSEFPINNPEEFKKSFFIRTSQYILAANGTFYADDGLTIEGQMMIMHKDLPPGETGDKIGGLFNQEFLSSSVGGVETPEGYPSVLAGTGRYIYPQDYRLTPFFIARGPRHRYPDLDKDFSGDIGLGKRVSAITPRQDRMSIKFMPNVSEDKKQEIINQYEKIFDIVDVRR